MLEFRPTILAALVTGLLAAAVADARDDLRTPAGTIIPVRFQTSHSSRTSPSEERVVATVRQDVRVGGQVAIPAGSALATLPLYPGM